MRASEDAPTLSNAFPLGNEAFLKWLFGDAWERAHVAGVAGDPSEAHAKGWDGGPARTWLRHLGPKTNNYFCVSLFTGDRRVEQDFEALWVLGIDDVGVGQKINPVQVEELLGEPSYVVETSQGNFQWGYRLRVPITRPGPARALQRAVRVFLTGVDGKDPGQENLTRYMRLPKGVNLKGLGLASAVGEQQRFVPFECRLPKTTIKVINEEGLAQLRAKLKVPEDNDPCWSQDNGLRRVNTARGTSTGDEENDPRLKAMRELGLVQGRARDSGMGWGFNITCPWVDGHTGRATTGTFYAPGRGFKCHHGHCANRRLPDLQDRLDEMLRDESGGLRGWADLEADVLPEVDPANLGQGPTRGVPMFRTGKLAASTAPIRTWIARGILTRGAVTMVFGPPNQGKSLLLTGWATALALGTALGRLRPVGDRYRVLTVFAEEDDDEQWRRFNAAALARFRQPDALDGQLERLVCDGLATLLQVQTRTGAVVETVGWLELVSRIEAFRPDVLLLDPLIELHTADENDNTKLKAVIGKLRELANKFAIAIVLAHHTRKGEIEPGTLDTARGASAIGGAVRMAFSVIEMTENEAKTFGISEDQRRFYLRVDEARNAYAPPASTADWFRKTSMSLSNGEAAPALEPWFPPTPVAPPVKVITALVDDLKGGCPVAGGQPWSPKLDDSTPRSVRRLLRAHGISRISEKVTLDALYAAGVSEAAFADAHRHSKQGLRTTGGLPRAAWEDD